MIIQRLTIGFLTLLLLLAGTVTLPLQAEKGPEQELLNWQKYDAALKQAEAENRHILVNFTTKWCVYCKVMDTTTYVDTAVVRALNERFVLAKVDGESYDMVSLPKGDITEKGLTRKFGVRGYPTTWLLEPDGSKIGPMTGYIDVAKMKYALRFVGENINEQMGFREFVEQELKKAGTL
jgi:thioredoxin-related protein